MIVLMCGGSGPIRGADAVIKLVLARSLPGVMTSSGLLGARIIAKISLILLIPGLTIASFRTRTITTVIVLIVG